MNPRSIPERVGPYDIDSRTFLGNGAFGWVCQGRDTETNTLVAVKFCKRQNTNSIKTFDREVKTLQDASHRNIVRILDYETTPSFNIIVLELCKCNLQEIFVSPSPPTDSEHKFICELLEAVFHLHKKGIVHRDIKPENILIQELATGEFEVKLTDFGLSLRVPMDGTSGVTATAGAGTRLWLAPEVYPDARGKARYSKPADCWSCGHIMYSLFCHSTGQPLPPPIRGREPRHVPCDNRQ
jgi:serine/threonine protein kinase